MSIVQIKIINPWPDKLFCSYYEVEIDNAIIICDRPSQNQAEVGNF